MIIFHTLLNGSGTKLFIYMKFVLRYFKLLVVIYFWFYEVYMGVIVINCKYKILNFRILLALNDLSVGLSPVYIEIIISNIFVF